MSEENERLYEETQRRLREVTTLYEASQACLSISDQKGLLTAIIEAAARATDAALGSVMLIDEEKGEYVFGAHYGLSEETMAGIEAELHIPLGEGLVGAVVTTGQPVVVADVRTDPRWIPMEMKEPMRSFLGVPLVGRDGQTLGVLTLSHPEVGAFDEDHARLLSTFANQAAMAIENARLYEQAQQEITVRKRAIEALRESEERYRRLVELSFEAIAIHREGRTVYINAAGAELLGASSPEELVGKPILDFVHPDSLETVRARVLQAAEGRVAPLVEEKLIRLDGVSVEAEVLAVPITYQGHPAVQVVARDITERKRAEEALRESEGKYRTILENIEDGYYEVDIAGKFTFFNDSLCRIFGYPEDELMGMNFRQLMDDETAKAVYQTFNAVYRTGKPVKALEHELIRQDGTRTFVEVSASLMRGPTGEPVGLRGIIRDITERKRAEEALRKSETLFHSLIESLPQNIFSKDLEGRFTFANQRYCMTEGKSQTDVLGKTDFDLHPPELAKKYREDDRRVIESGQIFETVEEHQPIGGERSYVQVIKSPVYDSKGQVTGILGIFWDITERKRAEEALAQQARELARSNAFITALSQVAARIEITLDPDQVMETLGAELEKLGITCMVGMLEPDGQAMVIRYTSMEQALLAVGQKLIGRMMHGFRIMREHFPIWAELVEQKRAVFVTDAVSLMAAVMPGIMRSVVERVFRLGGWVSEVRVIWLPLMVENQVMGGLGMWGPDLRESDLPMLSVFAAQVATALENARLYAAERRRTEELIQASEQLKRELSERKRAEEALRQSEEDYRLLFEQNVDGIIIITEGRIVRVNQAFCALHGLPVERVVGMSPLDLLHPEDRNIAAQRIDAIQSGEPVSESYVYRGLREGGSVFWVEVRSKRIEWEGGLANQSIVRDITERKQAEEELRWLKEFNEGMVQSMTEGIIVENAEGCLTFVNPSAAALLGYTPDELLGQHWTIVVPPDQQPIIQAAHERRAWGEANRYDIELIRRDGTRVPVLISGSPRFEEGRFAGTLAVFTDITERKQAEEALRESEERYRALYEDNPSMYFTVDTEGTVLSVNRFGAEQLGYTVEELIGKPVLDVFYIKDKRAVLEQLTAFLQNPAQIAHWEFRKVRKDGSMLWVKETARAVRGADGNTVVLIVCEDITERKRLEEQLRHAQKMEAIGTLAGGIAHDFNNLLTPIGGFAELLLWKATEGSQQHEYLRQIKIASERAAALTHQLLAFAQRARVEVHPLNLNDVAREVIALLERTIDKAISIEPYLADDLATVEGDAGQLHQVLLNLCLNARDAMSLGGRLIIETKNITLSRAEARTELDLEAGQYILLSVTDTGIGMDAEAQQHLFEPFFTTKEQGRGLGLAMVYGIVRGHGGTIHVYSELGQGSTLKVYLPVARRPTEDAVSEEAEVVGGTETVLVVDDEEPVRTLLQSILEEGGYTVLLAKDGVEAMELYTERSTEIDLVVLDIIMPRMGGRKTYERLREINPKVKVLLSSGYSENGQARDVLMAGARGFLQKPYDLRSVLRKVREALEG